MLLFRAMLFAAVSISITSAELRTEDNVMRAVPFKESSLARPIGIHRMAKQMETTDIDSTAEAKRSVQGGASKSLKALGCSDDGSGACADDDYSYSQDDDYAQVPCGAEDDLTWHGEPVLKGTINLYNIYVGTNADDYVSSTTPGIIRRFAEGLDQSSFANILTSYYDADGFMSNRYAYKGDAFITKPELTYFTTDDVFDFIVEAQAQKGWSHDSNGIVTIFFRGDLDHYASGSSWLTDFCAYHSSYYLGNEFGRGSVNYAYQVVGDTSYVALERSVGCNFIMNNNQLVPYNATGAEPICTPAGSCAYISPNNNLGADDMVGSYAHEINEAASDTYYGWYRDCDYQENADICYNYFGEITYANGVHYNLDLPTGKFLIQGNWRLKNLALGYSTSECAMGSLLNSDKPSQRPTAKPKKPTAKPTKRPTAKPTKRTTAKPTKPTANPRKPTAKPTKRPTAKPTKRTTAKPTKPTAKPTKRPTAKPTKRPTAKPTKRTTAKPTKPTAKPTKMPNKSL